jgi:hypothetical protein
VAIGIDRKLLVPGFWGLIEQSARMQRSASGRVLDSGELSALRVRRAAISL